MSNGPHPRGLYTLFFTEMWERLSYYGMRALLVLFLVDSVQHGGMGLSDTVATSIYGLYTAGAYLAALPGGWVSDRLLGGQRAVWYGGLLIAAGHFSLAIPATASFFLGLILVVMGTGLLKPNVSALVGQLYPEGGSRRDAGFTLFYMGINVGATLGPLICSALGERFHWHYGFAAAGVGMVLGLIQFRFTRHHLGGAGWQLPRIDQPAGRRRDLLLGLVGLAAWIGVVAPALAGVFIPNPVWLAGLAAYAILGLAAAWFGWAFFLAGLDADEKRRVGLIALLFLASVVFWSGFEQAGSSLNLFAERHTQRDFGGVKIPAGWFQSLNAGFVICLAPLVAALWLGLARRRMDPPLLVKFAGGLLFLAGGLAVVALGSRKALDGGPVLPVWLMMTYLLNSVGELFLSPVGLSAVTKLAPKRLAGQMMGVWFLATSVGNLLAGLLAGSVSGAEAEAMPTRFLQVVVMAGATGLLLLCLARPAQRLMRGAA